MPKFIHVVAGPTASGKSALALKLAQQENGEIINADSIQLYTDLPILTARPTADDTALIPHHLYGILEAQDKLSAAKWCALAHQKITDIINRNKTPVIVGGTGFYLNALVHGLSPIPDVPSDIRAHVTALQKQIGTQALHRLLSEKDPVMGAKLNPNDTQRVMRAFEILEATGKSLSYFQNLPPEKPAIDLPFQVTLVMPERDDLYARCDTRFQHMITIGVVDEVRDYLDRGHPIDAPVTRALGFTPLRHHLEGLLSLQEATYQACLETRHYAKRQVTWFKNQPLT